MKLALDIVKTSSCTITFIPFGIIGRVHKIYGIRNVCRLPIDVIEMTYSIFSKQINVIVEISVCFTEI